MPRAKSIVMDKLNPEDLRAHAARVALEKLEPYRIFSAKQRGDEKGSGYAVVHVDPTGKRELVMGGVDDRDTAKDFVELLQRAWVHGRRSVMMD